MLTAFEDGELLQRKELSKKTYLSLGVLGDILPITKRLGLIAKKLGNHKLFLTPLGKETLDAVENEKREKLTLLGNEIIKKSNVIAEAYNILSEEENITYDKLGLKLAKKFNKKWEHPATYRSAGRSCVDILSSFYLIERHAKRHKGGKGGGARGGYFGKRRHENILVPTAGTDYIISMLKTLEKEEANDISLLTDTQRKKENFKSLIDLELVERVGENKFELTEAGKQLKSTIGTIEENKVFRTILLKYLPALGTINILKEEKGAEEFSIWDLADTIKRYNNRNWKKSTVKVYAYKFLSWLKKANVIESGNYGRYRLTNDHDKLELNEGKEVIEEMGTSEEIKKELEKNEADMIFPSNAGYIKVENIEKVRDITISKSLRISRIIEEPKLKEKTFKAEITIKDTVTLIKLLIE